MESLNGRDRAGLLLYVVLIVAGTWFFVSPDPYADGILENLTDNQTRTYTCEGEEANEYPCDRSNVTALPWEEGRCIGLLCAFAPILGILGVVGFVGLVLAGLGRVGEDP